MLDKLSRLNPFRRESKTSSAGYSRAAWKRSFDAARVNRLTADWATGFKSLNNSLHQDLAALRQRSRHLVLNSDYAVKFLAMVKQNVVGADGMRLSVHALQPNGTLDEYDSKICTQGFNNWSKIGNCEVTGTLSFKDVLNLVVTHLARDGEALVYKINGQGDWGFQLQLIDPARLDEKFNLDLRNGNKIRMGVEVNSWGKPVAYHLIDQNINDPVGRGAFGQTNKHVRVPASDMMHLFIAQSAEQLRGYPWMHTAMNRLNMLNGYEEAAVTSARISASAMGVILSPDGDAAALADYDDRVSAPEIVADPGSFPVLPPGYDVKEWMPDTKQANYSDFVRATLRGLASGLNVSYHSLGNDLENVNFSSIRAGTLEEREAWKAIQGWVIEHFCNPVYSDWLKMALLRGRLANLPMSKFEKFNNPVWQPKRWPWVDPLKDIKAQEAAVTMGVKSVSDVIRETGRDPDEVWRELEKDITRLAPILAKLGQGKTAQMEVTNNVDQTN